MLLHTHTHTFTPGDFYTKTPLHTDTFTQTHSHAETVTQKLLHTDAFTHRSFYTEKLLHTDAFTHKHFYTQTLLQFTHKHFYAQRPELWNRNFTSVFGDRTSFRAKGLRLDARHRNFTSNLISCERVAIGRLEIAILPQFSAIAPHVVRKGCAGQVESAI